ncbi:MAG: hypothetical protein HC818_01120, partial [Synechococcaceae cyanobacterium RM1_1_27]|nr:hypothetical protein [Synechococcaceae cyanobacterium RM1_1_27]
VQNSSFINNIANSTSVERGGGIRNGGSGTLTLLNNTFTNNLPNPVSNSGTVVSDGNTPDACDDVTLGGLLESGRFTRCPDRIIRVNTVNAPVEGNGRRLLVLPDAALPNFTTNPFTVFDLRALTVPGEVLDGLDFDTPGSLDVSFDAISTVTTIIIDVTPPGSPADRLEIQINGGNFSAPGVITPNNFLI